MSRPYEPIGMTTDLWAQQPLTVVNIVDLIWTQDDVSLLSVIDALLGKPNYAGSDVPLVVRYEGKLWLEDGHHRIAAAVIRGETQTMVRILDKS